MKILIATGMRGSREAGAAGVAFHHAEELEKLGHQVQLWFLDDILESPRWPARLRDLEIATAISHKIRQDPSRFDVVNIHAPWGCIYGCHRKLFSGSTLPPYTFTMHGCEERYVLAMRLEDRKGRADHFAFKNRAWHRAYHQPMYHFSISTADFGAVVNREGWLLSELTHRHPFGRIWYVPNGVSPEFFLPREFREPTAYRLLFVGTWLDRKGIYYLTSAFADLASRIPQLTLTVAGCGTPEQSVKAFFPREFRERVMVYTSIDRNAMPEIYASHDIFVLPSLMEGMPLVLLEAMASAMPVVTTHACGMADVVEDEYNGLLVPAADSAALAVAIQRLSADVDLRKCLGLAGRETVRRYTWRSIALKMEHIFERALAVQDKRHLS